MQDIIIWGTLATIAICFLFFAGIYNRFVALKQRRKNAFSDIDVQLRQRYDLVPNLVETVKGYAAHEKSVLENVTAARASAMRGGNIGDRMKAEQALGGAMVNLMAVAEQYPQLKADANFMRLQGELADIENKIAAARRFFNNATSEYNTTIHQFPAIIVAKLLGYGEEVFFELDPAEAAAVKAAPKVNFGT